MKRVLCVRACGGEPAQWEWVTVDEAGRTSEVARGGGEALRAVAADRLVLVLDGEHVLSTVQRVVGAAKLARQAIPYALEDQLLCAPEALHFEIQPLGDDDYAVAAVERALLDERLAALPVRGRARVTVTADYLCLPQAPDGWTVAADADSAWVRLNATQGFRTHCANLPLLLARAVAAHGAPARVDYLAFDEAAEQAAAAMAPADLALVPRREPGPPLALFARQAAAGVPLDLAAGLRRERDANLGSRPWLVAAVVLLVAGLAHGAAVYHRASVLETEAAALEAANAARFHALFPHIGRVEDARAQATQALAERRAAGESAPVFFALLERAAQAAAPDAPALRFMAVSYAPGTLELTLAAPSMASVEAFRRRLGEDDAITAQTLSTEAVGGNVVGVLRLAERAP